MKKTIILSLGLAALLNGCAFDHSLRKETETNYSKNRDVIKQEMADSTSPARNQPLMYKVKGKWLGSKSVPLAFENKLPENFYKNWSFIFPGRATLATVSERITLVTGIPVRVKPDAYMPLALLVPGSRATQQQQQTQQANQPIDSFGSVTTNNATDYSTDMAMNFQGTLVEFLDRVGSRASVSWEYKDGAIQIYRITTRNFTLKTSPGDSSFSSSVGKTGTTQGGTSTSGSGAIQNSTSSSFSSDSNIKMNSTYSVWDSLELAIKATLSPIGKVSINQGTGTITVTDAKDNVDRVADLIERENLMLTRQVRIKVETINVSLNRAYEQGIDWNVVYARLNNLLNPDFTLNFSSPASLATAQSGALGFTISATGGQGGLNSFNGTSAMIKALSSVGNVVATNSSAALTTNRQPVPIALTDQVGYVASTTPAISAVGGTGGVPGLTPGTVTTGYILNMLPTVLDNGNILLQFAVDMSQLISLDRVTSGTGANQQSIQTPQVSSMQFVQRTSLKPGETLVLSGFERDSAQFDKRTLTEHGNSWLAGSSAGKGKRDALVIMITPIIEGGN